jgi:hypothetical protein
MAIARNPHTYTGILFDSPLMESSERTQSRTLDFLCSARVSFGGKKLLRGFILMIFLRMLVLGAFFVCLGLLGLGCVICALTCWFLRVLWIKGLLGCFAFRIRLGLAMGGATGSVAVVA